MTRYIRGSRHFVTSMTAPIASGWSDSRVGLSPTGKKRRLCTAHAITCRSRMTSERRERSNADIQRRELSTGSLHMQTFPAKSIRSCRAHNQCTINPQQILPRRGYQSARYSLAGEIRNCVLPWRGACGAFPDGLGLLSCRFHEWPQS
jgi:hypothetical protein